MTNIPTHLLAWTNFKSELILKCHSTTEYTTSLLTLAYATMGRKLPEYLIAQTEFLYNLILSKPVYNNGTRSYTSRMFKYGIFVQLRQTIQQTVT